MSFRCKTRDRNVRAAKKAARGFSLIEVVLAVGVVAFAIIAIIALFGSSLESARQVGDEDEALGTVRALPTFLQSQSFPTVYGWILASATTPANYATLYAYNIVPSPLSSGTASGDTAQMAVIYSSTNPLLTGTGGYLARAGRLFAIHLGLSPAMPLHLTAASTSVTTANSSPPLSASLLPPSTTGATGYGESILPIRATIYSVATVTGSNPSQIPVNDYPVFTYDTAVSR